jgi:hypothetical protein
MDTQPFIGQKLYVPTQLHLHHGVDDIAGGLAIVSHIQQWGNGKYFVGFSELPDGETYSYSYLLENQTEWAAEYGNQTARPNPDLRPEFNDDYGALYRGGPLSNAP